MDVEENVLYRREELGIQRDGDRKVRDRNG